MFYIHISVFFKQRRIIAYINIYSELGNVRLVQLKFTKNIQ